MSRIIKERSVLGGRNKEKSQVTHKTDSIQKNATFGAKHSRVQSTRSIKGKSSYSTGTIVFAKIKYCPFWPAVVLQCERNRCKVKFFPTGEWRWVDHKNMCLFNKSTLKKYGWIPRTDFIRGIEMAQKRNPDDN